MQTSYRPCSLFRRTPAERADQMLSWQRDDVAFFASGACHILAWAFMKRFAGAGYSVAALRRPGEPHAFHVYVTNGTRAFDYDGFTPEPQLIEISRIAEGCDALERLAIASTLEEYCTAHHHRRPGDFAFSPWDRAGAYIDRFV